MAADLLIDTHVEDSAAPVYPIVYLYRHFVELELKSVAALAILAAEIDEPKDRVKAIFRTHDLLELTQIFDDAFAQRAGVVQFPTTGLH